MLIKFFIHLRAYGVAASIRELFDLLSILDCNLHNNSLDTFYELAKTAMVKDQKYYDKFDIAFRDYFSGKNNISNLLDIDIPDQWLKKMVEKHLTDEEKELIQSLGGFEKVMNTFKQRLMEQKKRHQGGSKWVGTGGTSPFGAFGYNPEGIRMGQSQSRHRKAIKVWDKRQFKNLDQDKQFEKSDISQALRRLRQLKREGCQYELDLNATIRNSANNAGMLDITMVPEKQNNVKILMLFDVGGSMDDYVDLTQELFSQSRNCFKQLHYFYFHNCIYENVWTDNRRHKNDLFGTIDLLKHFDSSYKLIVVGDASMSPYELTTKFGSVEHMNEHQGQYWLEKVFNHFDKFVWLNPNDMKYWKYTQSTNIIQKITSNRMFQLSLSGLKEAVDELR